LDFSLPSLLNSSKFFEFFFFDNEFLEDVVDELVNVCKVFPRNKILFFKKLGDGSG